MEEVVVRILRPNQTILEMDQLTREQLHAGKTVTLPADCPVGTYTVQAGTGAILASTSFEVAGKDEEQPGPGSGGGETGGGSDGGSSGSDGSGGSNGQGSGEETSASPDTAQPAHTADGSVKLLLQPEGKPDASGLTKVSVTLTTIRSAYDQVQGGLSSKLILEVPEAEGSSGYAITVPASALTSLKEGKLELQTSYGSLLLSGGMFGFNETSGAKEVTFTIASVGKDTLAEAIKSSIGMRPLIDVSVKLDGEPVAWSNPDVPVVISIPYVPTPAELNNPESITVWYIDSKGGASPVTSGSFDPAAHAVKFRTSHFSQYAVVYQMKTFSDLSGYPWAKKPVEALAAKGIITGVTDDAFVPEAAVKRADFVLLLVRTLGLTASFDQSFQDIHPEDYYYEALGIARSLGITDGVENNAFLPNKEISRQDMMTLTARALSLVNKLQIRDAAQQVSAFNDANHVSDYAKTSIQALIEKGLIEGSDGYLHPLQSTSRAEAAVMLYRIYSQTRGL